MDTERLSGLGLEPILTTRELADYLGLNVQAIYDLRADGRGPSGVRVAHSPASAVAKYGPKSLSRYWTPLNVHRL